jgi:alkanesulfonate monooxygenase SsuD/methylene tetrahydromethanopterin reductase-like flavin-dependent oxidoreductase (luciferase family)
MLSWISGHFRSAWISDHLMDGQYDIPEALTTLSYLAGLYSQMTFGTAVIGQGYRNPALLAKMAATLQQLSGGRFILGIGAGWKEDEYRAYGYDFPSTATRIAQLAESVQICKQLWDPSLPEATFLGQHYRIERAVCQPKPAVPPPVMIGGAGEKLTLRVVAQHADWWNLIGASPEVFARKLAVLERHCASVDRDPTTIRKTWMGTVSIGSTSHQAQAQMTGLPLWPGDVALVGTPDEIIEQLQAYTALGVDLFFLSFADEPRMDGIGMFIGEVSSRFR